MASGDFYFEAEVSRVDVRACSILKSSRPQTGSPYIWFWHCTRFGVWGWKLAERGKGLGPMYLNRVQGLGQHGRRQLGTVSLYIYHGVGGGGGGGVSMYIYIYIYICTLEGILLRYRIP